MTKPLRDDAGENVIVRSRGGADRSFGARVDGRVFDVGLVQKVELYAAIRLMPARGMSARALERKYPRRTPHGSQGVGVGIASSPRSAHWPRAADTEVLSVCRDLAAPTPRRPRVDGASTPGPDIAYQPRVVLVVENHDSRLWFPPVKDTIVVEDGGKCGDTDLALTRQLCGTRRSCPY
jgi:hypothetical protein